MTERVMYFGTQDRMTWVRCPTIDSTISKVGWTAMSQFLNGGASVRSSRASHKEYQFTWSLASAEETAKVNDYADGLYGEGLIYFLDPFAVQTNLLPQHWAVPSQGIDDAPTFTKSDVRPTGVTTGANIYGYPTTSAVYTFDSSSTFRSLWIPLPVGYTFHFGAHGSSTGDARVTLNGTDITGLISVASSTRTNTTVTGVPGVTISFAGEGTLTLAGMIAQVRPTGDPVVAGDFISGRGNSGCRFHGAPSVQGYSSPQAMDFQSISATLIETGDWE